MSDFLHKAKQMAESHYAKAQPRGLLEDKLCSVLRNSVRIADNVRDKKNENLGKGTFVDTHTHHAIDAESQIQPSPAHGVTECQANTFGTAQRGFAIVVTQVVEFDRRTYRALYGDAYQKVPLDSLSARCRLVSSTRPIVRSNRATPWKTVGLHQLIFESEITGSVRINLEVGLVGGQHLALLNWRPGGGVGLFGTGDVQIAGRFLEVSLDVVISVNANRQILEFNSAAERTFGYSREEILGKSVDLLYSDPAQGKVVRSELARTGRWEGEILNRRKNGEIFVAYLSAAAVTDADGSVIGAVGISRDLTSEREREKKLHDLNLRDELTGLQNRKSFKSQVWMQLKGMQILSAHCALAILDIDRLKVVNDSLGHEAGDEVIKTVATRLSCATPEGGLLARLGGDEFAMFLRLDGKPDTALKLFEQWVSVVSEPLWVMGIKTQINASTGVAFGDASGDLAVESLLQMADTAMYAAKAAGGARIEAYSEELGSSALARFRIEHYLSGALGRKELSYLLQPKWDLSTGMPVGAELLLRWNSPGIGSVSPSDFIPVAETSSQISAIGEWALEQAAREIRAIQERIQRTFRIAVNVSAKQMVQRGFAERVKEIFGQANVSLELLELEITENVLLPEASAVSENIRALSAFGVRFLIDDFGTGFSSLSYLRKFNFHSLKIDKSFISQASVSDGSHNIISAIVSVARALNCDVVAEGVETEAQLTTVSELGCHYAQGFYLSRPVESSALLDVLLGGNTYKEFIG